MRKAARAALVVATIIGIAPATVTAAGALRDVKVSTDPVSILGGRLQLQLPPKARITPANATRRNEWPVISTQIEIGGSGEQMLVVAQELFALTPNDFEAAIRKQLNVQEEDVNFRLEDFDVASKKVKAIAVWSRKLATGDEATVLLTLFIAQRDRSVQMVAFMVNGAAAADPGGCKLLARRIARTLDAGPERLAWGGGVRPLRVPGTSRRLRLQVPKGFVLLRADESGSHRYQLQRMRRLDEEDPGTLLLKVVSSAAYDPNRLRPDVGMSERRLLGQEVKWFREERAREDGVAVVVEDGVIDPNLDDAPHLRLHVVISSPDPERLRAFRAIADGLDWSL